MSLILSIITAIVFLILSLIIEHTVATIVVTTVFAILMMILYVSVTKDHKKRLANDPVYQAIVTSLKIEQTTGSPKYIYSIRIDFNGQYIGDIQETYTREVFAIDDTFDVYIEKDKQDTITRMYRVEDTKDLAKQAWSFYILVALLIIASVVSLTSDTSELEIFGQGFRNVIFALLSLVIAITSFSMYFDVKQNRLVSVQAKITKLTEVTRIRSDDHSSYEVTFVHPLYSIEVDGKHYEYMGLSQAKSDDVIGVYKTIYYNPDTMHFFDEDSTNPTKNLVIGICAIACMLFCLFIL
ncbi:hypothetical protein EDD63_10478 [Breznakia blatticola]|uniref:DUF3592 domain-containing protein n=1 Tax=Breznakia blatticola TaxID=1754012 RepID=A0A4R8A5B0_9FIRM|nr:hypothetical protein [Breznakia blatticola]TDW25549.1 hypothetical protein EDD63_10478 [Breznakia blatticola]